MASSLLLEAVLKVTTKKMGQGGDLQHGPLLLSVLPCCSPPRGCTKLLG